MDRLRTTLLSFLILVAAAGQTAVGHASPYAQAVLYDKPRVYLRFDDLEGPDSKTTRDSTEKHHAKVVGELAAVDGVPGIGGQAAAFDGRTTVVTIANDGPLRLDSLSVEFWFRSQQAFNEEFWPGSATLISTATPGAGSNDWTINAASTKSGSDQGRLLVESGPAGKSNDLYLFSPIERHGQSGRYVSSTLPHLARCVDDMAFLMAMTSPSNVHGPAAYMQNTGFLLPGFPTMGA